MILLSCATISVRWPLPVVGYCNIQHPARITEDGTMAQQYDGEFDLVVAGLGAAGAAAAITASKLGASVLIAEKQAENAHTPNTRMSRGLIMAANDAAKATRYLSRCAGGMVPDDVLAAFAERATKLIGWLGQTIPEVPFTRVIGAEHPDFEGAEAIDGYQGGVARFRRDPNALTGRDLYASLKSAVMRTGASIAWSSPASRLITEDGAVTGILLDTPDGPRRIRARSGVVLTCGGFEYDEEAKLTYLRAHPMYFYGNPGNTGDGVRMAQAVGADLWHMGVIVGRAIGHFTLDSGISMGFQIGIDSTAMGYEQEAAGYAITDRFGKRFANENVQALLAHGFFYDLMPFDSKQGIYPRIPCFWFFDERRRRAGPISSPLVGANAVGLYNWSADNSAEIERGWIARGDTIREAAERAGVEDPAAAEETMLRYNAACKSGGDDAFGRPAKTMIAVDQPPYYCVKLFPGGSNTTGGPRRDRNARVIDVFGKPIPGLFAAGELGQVSGALYAADGANLCEALCFGQIAAETALAR